MMTVHEVSRLTGVSIRTLHYYDQIGLLHPAKHTEAGYRLYNETALETLQQILLFHALEFPLKEIREIIRSPGFDREKALDQQIRLLEMKKEHLENLIAHVRAIKEEGGKAKMDFSAFDTQKMEEYAEQARASWGNTPEYQEYEQKTKDRTRDEERELSERMMQIFVEFGTVKNEKPASEKVQALVRKLQGFITEHFYACSDQILAGLGRLYAGDGEMTENIDRYGGKGTAEFVSEAIRAYCER